MDPAFYNERAAEKNPTSHNPEMTTLVDRIEQWCHIRDGVRVLDVGCYDGYVLRQLLARARITGFGVDLAPAAIEKAASLSAGTDLTFMVSDGTLLPFPDESFDVVICSEILEHVGDLDAVIKELARVVAPGGQLYATMPNSLRDVWRPFHGLCRRTDRIEGHLRRMSRDEFTEAMAKKGFAPALVRYRGFILTAVWYRTVIYAPRVKSIGLRAVGAARSRAERIWTFFAFAGMWTYIIGDRPFSGYRGCLTIDAAFIKNGRAAEELR
jgi:SAM-dependent methyltransferase